MKYILMRCAHDLYWINHGKYGIQCLRFYLFYTKWYFVNSILRIASDISLYLHMKNDRNDKTSNNVILFEIINSLINIIVCIKWTRSNGELISSLIYTDTNVVDCDWLNFIRHFFKIFFKIWSSCYRIYFKTKFYSD